MIDPKFFEQTEDNMKQILNKEYICYPSITNQCFLFASLTEISGRIDRMNRFSGINRV